jgi:hypothetical protein
MGHVNYKPSEAEGRQIIFTIAKINWLKMFKEVANRCLQWESYKTHKYKIQR